MAYFPFFADIENMNILVVGGGTVALRKIEKLLPFSPAITVVAPQIDKRITALTVNVIRSEFEPELLNGANVVIAATDKREVNRQIAQLCREKNIPVNAVDDKEQCSFIFPSLVKKGNLTVGISTGGASPTAAIWLKEQINAMLPDNLPLILDYLESLRPAIKESVATEEKRAEIYKELFALCLQKGSTPSDEELREILSEENV